MYACISVLGVYILYIYRNNNKKFFLGRRFILSYIYTIYIYRYNIFVLPAGEESYYAIYILYIYIKGKRPGKGDHLPFTRPNPDTRTITLRLLYYTFF